MASQSTIANEARQVQRLAIVVATIRWHRGGASGLCADCGRQVDPAAEDLPRSLVHVHSGAVPEELLRLGRVAPGSRAESAAVDRWMREQQQRQAQSSQPGRRQSPVTSRAVCADCAARLIDSFLGNAGGTLAGALAALVPDQWSALFMTCEPGYARELQRLCCNGRGKVPALPDLLEVATEAA